MVVSSAVSFAVDHDANKTLMHYDYERNKGDDYPEAHIQIYGENKAWN